MNPGEDLWEDWEKQMVSKQPEKKEENNIMETKRVRFFQNDGVGNRHYRWRIDCPFLFSEE